MATSLFDDDYSRTRATGPKALVHVDTRTTCPTCTGTTVSRTVDAPALLRHGGYGATLRTVTRWCPGCDWTVTAESSERKP